MIEINLENNEAILIVKPENRYYLSGFTGSFGYVLFLKNEKRFITDFRYDSQARNQCLNFEICMVNKEYTIFEYLKDQNLDTLYIEKSGVTVDFLEKLQSVSSISKFKNIDENIGMKRIVKTDSEVSLIKKAQSFADKAFDHILGFIEPGISEKEIAAELEYIMAKNGASGKSFNTIVASGLRSSMPHGVASDKLVESGDFITMDFGCVYNGYCSDMTRTVVLGKASEEQRKIYNIVLEAQMKAFDKIRPGVRCSEIDDIARSIIDVYGYKENFGHGLGHGVGVEIHEAPTLSKVSDDVLKSGMIITNEPGIYIKDFGGVRIEDLIHVTDNGYEILSKSPKDLIEL